MTAGRRIRAADEVQRLRRRFEDVETIAAELRPLLPFMHDATKRELLQSVDHVVAGLAELRAEVVTKMVTGASGRAVTGRGDAGSEGAETLA